MERTLEDRLNEMQMLKKQLSIKYMTRPEFSRDLDVVMDGIDGRIREIKKEMGAA